MNPIEMVLVDKFAAIETELLDLVSSDDDLIGVNGSVVRVVAEMPDFAADDLALTLLITSPNAFVAAVVTVAWLERVLFVKLWVDPVECEGLAVPGV